MTSPTLSPPAGLALDPAPALDAASELRRSERRFRTLATTTSAVIWLTAPDGRATVANPSWQAFTGQVYDDYTGWGWLDAIHQDDRERVQRVWLEGLARGELSGLPYRLRRHDGEYRHMLARGAPVLDDEGHVVEWIGSCSDVTETQQAAQQLRASEERFRFLDRLGQATRETTDPYEVMRQTAQLLGEHLGASRCAYADVEPDNDAFTIRSDWSAPGVASSARGDYSLDLFGSQATSDLRHGRTLIVRDVDAELGPDDGGAMFNSIGIKAIICSPLVKDGRLTAMMAVHQAQPRGWATDEVLLVQEVVERCWAHIERIRDAAALREQDRRKDEFLATLAHELRNPLAPVRYAIAILKLQPGTAAPAAEACAIIDRQVTTMARLIDDLLDLSRVSRGLIELKHEPVSVGQVVESALETSRPLIEAARHQLEVAVPGADLLVMGDATRLSQVLSNLLNNAAKYTPAAGHIRVSVRQVGSQVLLEVADNGIGIVPGEQKHLFNMFVRSQREAHQWQRGQGGLGIGLALAKQLVEMHGGSIGVHSGGVDRGSCFTVSLPLAPEVSPAREPEDTLVDELPVDGAGVRVLVAEDNPEGLATLVALLEASGCEVHGAQDGLAALDAAARFRPDIVLLDIGMPGMSGYELAQRLRADPRLQAARLVALTGWGSLEDQRKAAQAGFDHHLTKPVEPRRLLRLIADLAGMHRRPQS
ncbi:ATP-binding protein [Caldimonas brevitalea]|uniref:histidine kinase n=1 Tax=Caldimonas brevitalea TaxID=413882 RepID=A8KCI6_9BURK|nr:ATP-binding protein [Caldimonas brevitalea]AKJ29083.1 chemotaxis protein methyltransferase CheR [Caldimonas brevitalea]CAL80818.1 two-component hybrid sensor/regulator [Caldimonas brevitalea]